MDAEALWMFIKETGVEIYGAKSEHKYFFYGQNAAYHNNMDMGNIIFEVLEQSNISEQH